MHNLSIETNIDHSDYTLAGSLVGVTLLGIIFCLFIGIAMCIIYHKRKGTGDNEREMPIYDTISPVYERAKRETILNLTVTLNDAYSV